MQEVAKREEKRQVVIRRMTLEDFARSLAFFESLSEEDRTYLRRDVTKPEVVERRLREIETGDVIRLVAVAGDRIVADGSIELSAKEWKKHVGELRLIIAPSHRRQGLGTRMARELFIVASGARVEEIVVKMMRPQKAARRIFSKLGFRQQAVFPDYVKDLSGARQDLIVMRCNLEALWRKMEDFVASSDWQRTQ